MSRCVTLPTQRKYVIALISIRALTQLLVQSLSHTYSAFHQVIDSAFSRFNLEAFQADCVFVGISRDRSESSPRREGTSSRRSLKVADGFPQQIAGWKLQ